jgi:hypothetical protein
MKIAAKNAKEREEKKERWKLQIPNPSLGTENDYNGVRC